MSIRSHAARGRERGGALLVAMVMIFMLSIMGVSAMRSSTLERRMTNNAIQSSTTLQAAESASDLALNTPSNLTLASNRLREVQDVAVSALREDIGMDNTARLVYVGEGAADGYSFGEGSNFIALRFIAQGEAEIDDVRASSIVRQGAYRVVPGL